MTPLISPEVMELIKARFDVPATPSDSNDKLRWKCAQRAVVLDLLGLHHAQQEIKINKNKVPNNSSIDPRVKD